MIKLKTLLETVFWGDAGAGALFVAEDTGKLLVCRRAYWVNEHGTWNLVGGALEGKETSTEAVEREIKEETGYSGGYRMSLLYIFTSGTFTYHNYLITVPKEFGPEFRDGEHDEYLWVEFGKWPKPLHFGLAALIEHAGSKIKREVDAIKEKLTQSRIERNI